MFQRKWVAAFNFRYFMEGKSSENSMHCESVASVSFNQNSKKKKTDIALVL